MGSTQVSATGMQMNGLASSADTSSTRAHRTRIHEFDWQGICFLAVTVGLAVYGYYLAFESWRQLLQVLSNPGAGGMAFVSTAIQCVAPLVPPLSLLMIYLSWRRDAPWFLRTGALCLLGLLAGVIEVLGNGFR